MNRNIIKTNRDNNYSMPWALYLLIASLPLELIATGSFLTIPKLLGIVALFLFFLRVAVSKKPIYLDASIIFFIIFFVFSVASISWSVYPDISVNRAFSIFQLIILYMLIINEIDSTKSINYLMTVSVFGGAILAFSGLYELFQSGFSSARITGFSGNANIYFIMAIFSIPALHWTITNTNKKSIKALAIIVLGIFLYTSVYTQSRGGLISLGIFFGTYFLFSRRKFSVFFGILIVTAVVLFITPTYFWQRFLEVGTTSLGRFTVLWPAGWKVFLSKKYFGYGIGTSSLILPDFIFSRSLNRISVHNALLAVGIDLGIIGVILYLVVMIIPTFKLFKLITGNDNPHKTKLEKYGVILFCVLMAYLASWFKSGGFEYFKYLWVLIGLENVVSKIIIQDRKIGEVE